MIIGKREIAIGWRNFYNDTMKTRLSISFFLSFWLILTCGACSGDESANGGSANANVAAKGRETAENVPQDGIEELAKIVKLDVIPEEATYLEVAVNARKTEANAVAPNEKRLAAVLRFSPENAALVVARAVKYKAAAPSDIDAENWFPAELVAQSQLTGDESLKGTAYEATDFVQAPYRTGKITRINNTDYFVLELTTF